MQLDYPDIPFHMLLHHAAARRPNAAAIEFQGNRISFHEWDRDASRLAHALLNLRVQKGDRLALFSPNRPEYEAAFFGIARAGAAPTPLNPSYKEREVLYQLQDSEAVAVFVDPSLFPVVAAVREQLPYLQHVITFGDAVEGALAYDSLLRQQPDNLPDVPLNPDDLAALPYSSGTTGTSKGVMLTQRNLVVNAHQFVHCTRTTQDDTLLIFLPLYHIYGVILMATAVTGMARQVLLPRFDLERTVRDIEHEGVTELFVVPPVMLALANSPGLRPEQFRSVRFIKSAAAPLAEDIARRVAERLDVRVIQAYGMTEASPLTHMVPLDESGFDNVGVVAPDTECKIVDLETGERVLPAREVGEVTVAGPQVMAGYWQAPEATASALRDGRLYTGDVGYEDEAGRLYVVDRKKEMIKYNAFSVAPAELEAVLLEHPAVVDCAVIGVPDAESGEVPKAFVVIRPHDTVSDSELMAFVADRVAGYKQVRQVEVVESIPRTPSGKILRRALKGT